MVDRKLMLKYDMNKILRVKEENYYTNECMALKQLEDLNLYVVHFC